MNLLANLNLTILWVFIIFPNYFTKGIDLSKYPSIFFPAQWPNGKVKYLLHESLEANDRKEWNKAIEDYHKKTCIRFELKQPSDRDYISVEIDPNVSGGAADWCRIAGGGKQYARFGSKQSHMNTIIHELGHSLCLDHEQQRADRDNYVSFRDCENYPSVNEKGAHLPSQIYNYQSIMHYACGSCGGGWPLNPKVKNCGMWPDAGLSILDADRLNDMYKCEGCFRHRWRNASQLTPADRANFHSFGYTDTNQHPLIPCRTIHEGQVIVGTFEQATATCVIVNSQSVHNIRKDVEILTIPGGPAQQCYTYKVVDHQTAAAFADAVPAAANNDDRMEKMYIAYGLMGSIGRVWGINGFTNSANVPVKSRVVSTQKFSVLTCSLDQQCLGKIKNGEQPTASKYVDNFGEQDLVYYEEDGNHDVFDEFTNVNHAELDAEYMSENNEEININEWEGNEHVVSELQNGPDDTQDDGQQFIQNLDEPPYDTVNVDDELQYDLDGLPISNNGASEHCLNVQEYNNVPDQDEQQIFSDHNYLQVYPNADYFEEENGKSEHYENSQHVSSHYFN